MHKNAWPPGLDARKRAKRGKGRERQKWEKDERRGEWRRDGRDEKGQERGGWRIDLTHFDYRTLAAMSGSSIGLL